MGTGQLCNLQRYCGHGQHGGPFGFAETVFLGCIVSHVPGNMQGHFKIHGLTQGVQHGATLGIFIAVSSVLTLSTNIIYSQSIKLCLLFLGLKYFKSYRQAE